MINNLPTYINLVFVLTTLLTVWLFIVSTHNNKKVLLIIAAWLTIHALLGLQKFYTNTSSVPPRFMFLILPPFLLIIFLFITISGRAFIDNLNAKTLTYLHVVRIPVEIVLFWLFLYKQVPQLMTFEGRNFDIFSGMTAPIVAYLGFTRKKIPNSMILLWNFICLGLLLNIIINAILSAPFPFQKFGYDQPNVAVLYFPFVWLPCCIVPIVLLAHLAVIRHILKGKTNS